MGNGKWHKKKAEVIRFLYFISSKTPPVSFGDQRGVKISLLLLRC